jgi:hypothetical protein
VPSPLTEALIEQLVRVGVLEAEDIDEMAARLDAGDRREDARAARIAFVQAQAPSDSEWEAERRRARMHVVSDGGNPPT